MAYSREPMVEPSDPVAALLARQDDLRHAERRAASARVASVIGHLIGTPLNVIAGRAALIRTNHTAEAVNENVRRIEEQVERLAQRIRRLIEYMSVSDPKPEPRSLGSVLEETLALYQPVAAAKNVSIDWSAESAARASIDGQPALLVLTCLLSLATRSSAPGSVISLSATEHSTKTVMLELLLPSMQTPPSRFDRLEPPEEGTSYDSDVMQVLSICLSIARRNGGALDVAPGPLGSGVLVRYECARL
jgi:signal transduction histidine kinase